MKRVGIEGIAGNPKTTNATIGTDFTPREPAREAIR
jgi:hypothetical protein